MKKRSDLSVHIQAIATDPDVVDFFIVISSKGGTHFGGKTIGPEIISALAKTIVEKEGGLSAVNRMQLAIFKAKDLAKQILEKRFGGLHKECSENQAYLYLSITAQCPNSSTPHKSINVISSF